MSSMTSRDAALGVLLACSLIPTAWGIAYVTPPPRPTPDEVRHVRELARLGYVSAETDLAGMYSSGWGVLPDQRRAAIWFLRAAQQGDTFARYQVVERYESGEGLPRSHSKAVSWYHMAKRGRDHLAQYPIDAAYILVLAYQRNGDWSKRAEWLRICANVGNAWCQQTLARDYRDGAEGLPRDFTRSIQLLLRLVDHPVGESDYQSPSPAPLQAALHRGPPRTCSSEAAR